MRDILDPADIWLGTPGGELVFGNKRPVVLNDFLTVQKDGGPVTVVVLANDFDPEGDTLTLVSASAALGSAVAEPDNTVTYMPPAGLTGTDTVVYEVADNLDQRMTGQINVTILGTELTISSEPDNTLVVNAETGMIDITVTNPQSFAGTYSVDTGDLATGPVNLVTPAVSGPVEAGQTLAAESGLWIYDTEAGVPVQDRQWQRAGADIAGETSATYLVQPGDVGQGISVVETMTDTHGSRSAVSAVVGTSFLPSNDPALLGWWDASDAATITDSAGAVSQWSDKAGGTALSATAALQEPRTGERSLNALNVLDFNGSAHMEAGRTFPATGDVAFHMVMEIDGVSNLYEAALAVEATNDFQIDAGDASQFDGRFNSTGIGTPTDLQGGPFSGAMILSVIMDLSGAAQVEAFIAGQSRGTTAYATPLDFSAALHIMTNRSKNAWLNGSVGEIVITGDVTNRTQYHAYLSAKWGVA